MSLNPVQIPQKQSSGGGLFGKLAGTVAGGVAGTFVGHPLAGAALGGNLGGMVGEAIKPGGVSGGNGVPLMAMENTPGVKLANLVDAHKALMASPDFTEPQKQELSQGVYIPAIEALKKNQGVG